MQCTFMFWFNKHTYKIDGKCDEYRKSDVTAETDPRIWFTRINSMYESSVYGYHRNILI